MNHAILAAIVLGVTVSSAQETRTEQRLEFEVASVKPAQPASGGGRGGTTGPCAGFPRLESNRLVARNVSTYTLIALAYGKRQCDVAARAGLISGGPAWVSTERFEIQALIPQGSPGYTGEDLRRGNAPQLQAMLQALLSDRFKLVLRREMKQTSVYELTIARGGPKLQPVEEGKCTPRPSPEGPKCGTYSLRFGLFSAFAGGDFDSFTYLLNLILDRPVIDKTGISGMFDVVLKFAPDERSALAELPPSPAQVDGTDPSIFTAIQEQLGLKLEPTRASIEALVIDHIEKPSPN